MQGNYPVTCLSYGTVLCEGEVNKCVCVCVSHSSCIFHRANSTSLKFLPKVPKNKNMLIRHNTMAPCGMSPPSCTVPDDI